MLQIFGHYKAGAFEKWAPPELLELYLTSRDVKCQTKPDWKGFLEKFINKDSFHAIIEMIKISRRFMMRNNIPWEDKSQPRKRPTNSEEAYWWVMVDHLDFLSDLQLELVKEKMDRQFSQTVKKTRVEPLPAYLSLEITSPPPVNPPIAPPVTLVVPPPVLPKPAAIRTPVSVPRTAPPPLIRFPFPPPPLPAQKTGRC